MSSRYDSKGTEEEKGSLSRKGPEELEEEIMRIRAEMDQTLSAIENRLTLPTLLQKAAGSLPADPGGMMAIVARVVRDNPFPALLAGLGLTWLTLAGMREGVRCRPGTGEREGLFRGWEEIASHLGRTHRGRRGRRPPPAEGWGKRKIRRKASLHRDVGVRRGIVSPFGSWGSLLGAALGASLPVRR